MRKLFTLLFFFLGVCSFAQLINYKVEIVSFSIIGCDDGWGDDEEPTWKLWGRDDQNTSWVGGVCQSSDGNITHVFQPSGSDKILLNVLNTSASAIELKFEAWEDDNTSNSPGSPDRCSFDSGDDCHEFWDPLVGTSGMFPSIDIFYGDQCTWENYIYSVGSFSFEVRVKWEYSDFDGGPSQTICGTENGYLDAEGSGQWSIYSGTGGGFTNTLNPNAGFSGVEGETYQLLWSILPGCISSYLPDTVNVYVYELPMPELQSNVTKYCDGDEVTFDAYNANSYDFYVNSLTTAIESNVTGQFDYTLSIGDSVVYVESSNTNCTGIDSITFEVLPSPSPVIELNNGILATTSSYPFNQWYYNNNSIPGATTSSYQPTQNGTYTIEVANAQGCVSTATYILNNIGVSELQHEFVVYPNPASDFLYVDGVEGNALYELRDQLGRVVKMEQLVGPIELYSFSAGIYFLRVFTEEGRSSIHKIEIIK